jgi:hypothetical protein
MTPARRLAFVSWLIPLSLCVSTLVLSCIAVRLQTGPSSVELLRGTFIRRATYLVVLAPLFIFLAQRVPQEGESRARTALKLACWALLVLIPYEILLQRFLFGELVRVGLNRTDVNLTAAMLLLARASRAWETGRSIELRRARADAELSMANLRLLDAQLRPHFVFNALNGVLGLAYDDVGNARRLVRSLRDFLARSLDPASLIPLDEELAIVGRYTDIERIRFGESLQVDIAAGAEERRCLVPRMLLQPLVENAIRHGGGAGIDAELRGTRLCIDVINRGVASEEEWQGQGIGLTNARARLEAAYGADASLRIVPGDGGRTCVSICMPRSEA